MPASPGPVHQLPRSAAPCPQASVRLAQDSALDWRYPWRWSLRRLRQVFPVREVLYIVVMCIISVLLFTYIFLDAHLFGHWEVPRWVRQYIRPLLGFVVRTGMRGSFQYALSQSRRPEVRFWGVIVYTLKEAMVLVWLVLGCSSWRELGVVMALDWGTFLRRTVTFLFTSHRPWARVVALEPAPVPPALPPAPAKALHTDVEAARAPAHPEAVQVGAPSDAEDAAEALARASPDAAGPRKAVVEAKAEGAVHGLRDAGRAVAGARAPDGARPAPAGPDPRERGWRSLGMSLFRKAYWLSAPRCMALPETVPAHYEAFHYLMRNFALSAVYAAVVLGYGWLWLLGLGPGHAVVDVMFARGHRSLLFLLVALGLDVVQDLVAHLLVWYVMKRHTAPCSFTLLYPGLLCNRGRLWMMLRVTFLLSLPLVKVCQACYWLQPTKPVQ